MYLFNFSNGYPKYDKPQTVDSDAIPRDVVRYSYPDFLDGKVLDAQHYPSPYPLHKPMGPVDAWPSEAHNPTAGKAGVFLCNRDLWEKFHRHITEMIVTKQGRCVCKLLSSSSSSFSPSSSSSFYPS